MRCENTGVESVGGAGATKEKAWNCPCRWTRYGANGHAGGRSATKITRTESLPWRPIDEEQRLGRLTQVRSSSFRYS